MINIFYFKSINKIGGTEQFLYELAKKYNNFDITIFYDRADEYQLERLRKYFRCKKRVPGEKIKCKKIFYNFNLDMIDDVEAEDHVFVTHGIFQELPGYEPEINHPKITKIIGVSQYACDMVEKYCEELGINIKPEKCINPLTLEKQKKVKIIVSACRLNDEVKGGVRTQKLIKALDKYCEKHPEEHYMWLIFTNPCKLDYESKNVVIMPPRIDIRPYIAMADYLAQLSNDMETYCYSINEALGYGVPIISTPLTVLKEFPITDNEHIILNWNCSNIDKVAEQVFTKEVKKFNYNPPESEWEKFLAKGKNKYKEEKNMKYLVEATDKYERTNTWDGELSQKKSEEIGEKVKYFPKEGEQWEVDYERKEKLVEKGFVKVIKEIEDEIKQEEPTEEEPEESEVETEGQTDENEVIQENEEQEEAEQTTDEIKQEESAEEEKEEVEEKKETKKNKGKTSGKANTGKKK